ncbi:C2H2-type zinc finger-containing protein [Cavenderia fasciculata]|uniref:U1 small nuclear ribonucleoprotein C n=1 Tax=Cavenderia fasciculata TaxID=261658 RepID=F4PH74_CACFS|nr:C2H2-type zinc finger-containing protein [Cavenderia fasciculata]EGG25058.1 C2H2-type zinc finger-containing protein [Cavenderia fasciculata]|eukprot:XP_004362909.1 C2H2-type zinc finger-containing protein [Cavenderia fasciculata]
MPKYYCEYCDKYLTHDSPSVRRSHIIGKVHQQAVRLYYQQFEADYHKSITEQRIKEMIKPGTVPLPQGPPMFPQAPPHGMMMGPSPYGMGGMGMVGPPGMGRGGMPMPPHNMMMAQGPPPPYGGQPDFNQPPPPFPFIPKQSFNPFPPQ